MDLVKYRKWSWPINALIFNLCRLVPFRNKRLWLFGESSGLYYGDNCRYLYEYVCNHPEYGIRCIWLTKNKHILSILKSSGYEGYYFYSIKSFWLSLRCGVAIYNKSLDDLGLFPLVGGAAIITPWHGVGFKRIHNASLSGGKLKLKLFVDHIFSWKKMHKIMATSDYSRNHFHNLFTIDFEDICITGQPRNDVLLGQIDRNAVLSLLNLKPNNKIILYLPTHRSSKMGADFMEKLIGELVNDDNLKSFLKKNGYTFVIKPHPLTKVDLRITDDCFRLLTYGEIKDNQMLLAAADILVSDYSSVFVDFALLERPIILYVPDQENYFMNNNEMAPEYFEILELCKAKNVRELVSYLHNPILDVTEATNRLFRASDDEGHYCQNVYHVIKDYLNI